MEILLWVVAGIVGLNAGLIALAAALTGVRQHRRRREIRTLETQWRLDGVSTHEDLPALTPHSGLVGASSADRSPALTPQRGRGVPITSRRERSPTHYRGAHVRPRPSRGRTSGRRSVQVLVLAVVVCAGTALASSDARNAVTSALGAIARAFGVDPGPDPTGRDPGSSVLAEPETNVGSPIGTRMRAGGPTGTDPSVDATDTDLTLPLGPDREFWPRTAPAPPHPVAPNIVPPGSPTDLTALPVSSTQIDLTWTDVATETGYRIESSLDGEVVWTTIGTTGRNVTDYSDSSLDPGTNYLYRVFAINAGGDSPASAVTSAATHTDPPSPTDELIATSMSSTQIDLSWSDVPTETEYRIERSLDGETGWAMLAATGQDVTNYSDSGLDPGTTYYYRVFAINAGGDSPSSSVTSATTHTDPPSPPDGLTATSVSSTQIDLSWSDVATETGYRIERSLDGETEWTAAGTADRDITTFSDRELTPGTNYYYRVFATNAGGDSPASTVSPLTTTLPSQS